MMALVFNLSFYFDLDILYLIISVSSYNKNNTPFKKQFKTIAPILFKKFKSNVRKGPKSTITVQPIFRNIFDLPFDNDYSKVFKDLFNKDKNVDYSNETSFRTIEVFLSIYSIYLEALNRKHSSIYGIIFNSKLNQQSLNEYNKLILDKNVKKDQKTNAVLFTKFGRICNFHLNSDNINDFSTNKHNKAWEWANLTTILLDDSINELIKLNLGPINPNSNNPLFRLSYVPALSNPSLSNFENNNDSNLNTNADPIS